MIPKKSLLRRRRGGGPPTGTSTPILSVFALGDRPRADCEELYIFLLSRSLRIVERFARAFPLLSPAWEGPNGGSGKKTHICKRRKTAFVARSHYEILKKKILHSSIWPGRMWKVYTCGFFGILLESTKPTKNGSLSLPLLSAAGFSPLIPQRRDGFKDLCGGLSPPTSLYCIVLYCTVNVLCWREAGKGRKRELKKPLRTKI